MKNNEFLVRVKGYKDGKEVMITAFRTDNLLEYIKTIDYMMTNDIFLDIPDDDSVAEEYQNKSFIIDDFSISIASNISLTCLDIWVKEL